MTCCLHKVKYDCHKSQNANYNCSYMSINMPELVTYVDSMTRGVFFVQANRRGDNEVSSDDSP